MGKIALLLASIFFINIIFVPEGVAKQSSFGSKRRKQMGAVLQLRRALKSVKKGNHIKATQDLFRLMRKPSLAVHKNKMRYNLGLSLYSMGLYHPAIFQFRTLVANPSSGYVAKSLEKLALAAARLKDDKMLSHVVAKGSLRYVPKAKRGELHYYIGEYWLRKRNFRKASAHFARVTSSSPLFYKALYQLGLVNAELGRPKEAARIFHKLQLRRSGVTDDFRIAALIGKARSYYQAKQWASATESYNQVPKDSPFWHDTLLEKSWSLLREGRLRSALSNFHTLHSPYYEKYYQPESLLLRAIIYIYICKYYEMEKVLDLFDHTYKPVLNKVNNIIKNKYPLHIYYQSLLLSADENNRSVKSISYPLPVARQVMRSGDFSALHYYITKLKGERDLIYRLPSSWKRSMVGKYSSRIVKKRLKNAQKSAGIQVIRHIKQIQAEVKDFMLQAKYLRYEMLRSKRGFLKQKIAQKITTGVSIESFDRSFYIQNGYEYWPFQGEYWLDELGNYHYIGRSSCQPSKKKKLKRRK